MSKPIDYAKTMGELETVLAKLQDAETSLDEAIALHKEGKKLVGALETYLQDAEIIVKRQVAGQ